MIKGDWTISFLWRPESSWREVHGTLPIALVRLSDNTYLSLYYEATYDINDVRVGGQFVLTDGVNSITITADSGWLFADVLKFAVSHESGVGTTLSIETPAEGTLSGNSASINLSGYLVGVQFSANANGEVKGIGAYGDCQFWDTALTGTDVQKVFDFDVTAPASTLRQTNMVFARDSVAYSIDYNNGVIQQFANNKSDQALQLVTNRPSVVVDETITDSHVLLWTDGDRCFSAVGDAVVSTADGENFTEEFSLTDEPFASDIGGSSIIRSGVKLPDGSKLLAAESGHIWRHDGTGWTLVLTMTSGYAPTFGWGAGIRGAEVVIGEYGARGGYPNTAIRLYYSPDFGQTWGIIYTHPKDSADGLHIHQAFFHPSNTDTIYGVAGDGDCRHLFALHYNNGDKKDSANWDYEELGLNIQPSSSFLYQGRLYLGQDGTQSVDSTVSIFDPDSNRLRISLGLPVETGYDEAPYALPMGGAYVWRMTEANGYLLALASLPNGDSDGIYIHNGSSWARLVAGACDFGVVLPPDSLGRIWFNYWSNSGLAKAPAYITLPTCRTVPFVRAQRTYTNILSVNNSIFQESVGDWYLQADATALSVSWDDSVALIGAGSAKVTAKGLFRLRRYLTLAAGKNYLATAFIRFPDELIEWYQRSAAAPRASVGPFSKPSSDLIYTDGFATHFYGNWFLMSCWIRTVTANASGIMVRVTPEDYPWPELGLEFHVDGVQLIELDADDIYHSGQFQPGGAPRADEILIAPAFDVGRGGVEMAGFIGGRGFIG